jgi:hypothetical protein
MQSDGKKGINDDVDEDTLQKNILFSWILFSFIRFTLVSSYVFYNFDCSFVKK